MKDTQHFTPQELEELEALQTQLWHRVRKRVLAKLQRIPDSERDGTDLMLFSGYSTDLLFMLAQSTDLHEATAELHKMRAQNPDTASTTEDARDRLVRIREEFSDELSILSDTYERFATARNLMDIGADPKEMLRRVKIVFGITDREMDIECRDGPNEPWFGSMLAGKPLSELEFMQRAVNYYRSASETRGTKH